MSNSTGNPPHRVSAVSKWRKKVKSRVGHWLSKRRLRVGRKLRAWTMPIYKKFGITSIARLFIPGYRIVTKSPGGLSIQGNYMGDVVDYPTIATLGDYGSGKKVAFEVADLIAQQKAHAVVTLGDNVYYETGFQTLVGNLYGDYLQHGAFFPAVGNHDYTEGRGIKLFDRYFDFLRGHRWYSVSFDRVEFFLLDSTQALTLEESFEEQSAWLERAVKESSAEWKIVVVHHPPHSARARSQPEFRFPFDKWGVSMVMSGHDHTLQHLIFDGVHFVVNGIGGGSIHEFEEILEGTEFRLSGEYGAVFLDVLPDTLRVRSLTVPSGQVHVFEIPQKKSAKASSSVEE